MRRRKTATYVQQCHLEVTHCHTTVQCFLFFFLSFFLYRRRLWAPGGLWRFCRFNVEVFKCIFYFKRWTLVYPTLQVEQHFYVNTYIKKEKKTKQYIFRNRFLAYGRQSPLNLWKVSFTHYSQWRHTFGGWRWSALCRNPLRDFCRSHEFISSIYLFAVFGRPFNPFSFHLGLRVGGNIPPKLEHRGGRLEMFFSISFSPHFSFTLCLHKRLFFCRHCT